MSGGQGETFLYSVVKKWRDSKHLTKIFVIHILVFLYISFKFVSLLDIQGRILIQSFAIDAITLIWSVKTERSEWSELTISSVGTRYIPACSLRPSFTMSFNLLRRCIHREKALYYNSLGSRSSCVTAELDWWNHLPLHLAGGLLTLFLLPRQIQNITVNSVKSK